jgi:hypothetical protein
VVSSAESKSNSIFICKAEMTTVPYEKPPSLGPYTENAVPSKNSTLLPSFSTLANAYSRFSSWHIALALPNPGSVENLQKEVKSEFFCILQVGWG